MVQFAWSFKTYMFWSCQFYKIQFCKWIMLSCVIKFAICESILYTHLKFVFGSMLYYNDDGLLVNIKYNDHLKFYTSIAHLFLIFLNYAWLDLSSIICFDKCSHIIDKYQRNFLMQTLQGIHFVDFCFGFHFFGVLSTKARILCLDSL